MSNQHVIKNTYKKPPHSGMKPFLSQVKYGKYLFFYFMIIVLLSIVFLGPNYLVPLLRAQTPSPSFTFTAGGDFGGNSSSSATLDQIAKSGSAFHLAIGDLSYSEITPESAWCSYVQSHLGSNFPVELVSGNHEDGVNGQDATD